jgi:asparagine N-glycosylation enzyme membrane subunit Stt3
LADTAPTRSSIAPLRTSVFGDCDYIRADRPLAKEISMLWTIAVLLLILWALGMVSSYTLGGFIHILLVLAIVVVLIRVIQGRSPVV